MVRLWSAEIGDVKRVVEPIAKDVDPRLEIDVNGGEGFRKDTFEVRVRKGQREALCIMTFEAVANARTDPGEMSSAIGQISAEMDAGKTPPAYLLTSRGLGTQTDVSDIEVLRDIAASKEADVLAEQFFKRGRR